MVGVIARWVHGPPRGCQRLVADFIDNNAAATEHLIEMKSVSGRGEGDDNNKFLDRRNGGCSNKAVGQSQGSQNGLCVA